jgi:hypothetical protein
VNDKQIWTVIALFGVAVFAMMAVEFKRAGITAGGIDAFLSGIGRGEAFAALGVTFTGIGGFFIGKLKEKRDE